MHRPFHLCSFAVRSTIGQSGQRRLSLKLLPATTKPEPSRSVHLTACSREKEPKTPKSNSSKPRSSSKREKSAIDEELQDATIKVAKAMHGDWNKTAEVLLARLQMQKNPDAQKPSSATEVSDSSQESGSVLSSMKVGRAFEPGARRLRVLNENQDIRRKQRPKMFMSLSEIPRLGIFDAKKMSEQTDGDKARVIDGGLWERVSEEKIKALSGGIPKNAFEETIEWTKQGKVWVFPVDNEADMHEERQYKFHDHVFLERHLTAFPDKGPIRKFMELVVLGLSNNPWLSVPEKIEHINWFEQYFREKQDILEASIGEQGRMKEGHTQLE